MYLFRADNRQLSYDKVWSAGFRHGAGTYDGENNLLKLSKDFGGTSNDNGLDTGGTQASVRIGKSRDAGAQSHARSGFTSGLSRVEMPLTSKWITKHSFRQSVEWLCR